MTACVIAISLSLLAITGSLVRLGRQLPKEIEVVKFSWQKERIRQRPSLAPLASAEALREQVRNERLLAAARNTPDKSAARSAQTAVDQRNQAEVKARQTPTPEDGYRYRVTLKNNSAKTIKSIDWDYLFLDPTDQSLIARHEFTSDETVKPGKSREISVLYFRAPVQTIDAKMLEKKPLHFTEQVVVARVRFSDGSVWQDPLVTPTN